MIDVNELTKMTETCEPIEKHFVSGSIRIGYNCSACGSILIKKQKVCDGCGRKVKWK